MSPQPGADAPSPTGSEAGLAASPTKMSQAVAVYRRMSRKKGTTRKEIVAAFIEEVGLMKAGAATYYQIIKKGRS
jgi:hypothetical protein